MENVLGYWRIDRGECERPRNPESSEAVVQSSRRQPLLDVDLGTLPAKPEKSNESGEKKLMTHNEFP